MRCMCVRMRSTLCLCEWMEKCGCVFVYACVRAYVYQYVVLCVFMFLYLCRACVPVYACVACLVPVCCWPEREASLQCVCSCQVSVHCWPEWEASLYKGAYRGGSKLPWNFNESLTSSTGPSHCPHPHPTVPICGVKTRQTTYFNTRQTFCGLLNTKTLLKLFVELYCEATENS
jgi:hypothetical protein